MHNLVKTGSERIEATLRSKKRILLAGFVASVEDTRLPMKCAIIRVEVRFSKGEWMGYLLDNLRAFGIQTDQWMIAIQDADE